MERTIENGVLRLSNVNENVTLVGWVAKKRNFGSLVFIDLRDRTGICQIVCKEEFAEVTAKIRNEYVIKVSGKVVEREQKNPNLPTGDVEVIADEITIINVADTTPLIIADQTDALEDTRLKYRYLDLRRPCMQQKIIERHKITRSMRNFLDEEGFIEIETPLLGKTTPEGARDYLVPSRMNPGKFYALPQSPQLYKQLLMISGFEKYYQVARCFRDEDLRSDRQPDFTQVDIEMSFMSEKEIMDLMERLFERMFREVKGYELKLPIRRVGYKEALSTYGSDKPDTRFGYELCDVTSAFENTSFVVVSNVLAEGGTVRGLRAYDLANKLSRKDIDAYTELAKKYHAKGLMWCRYVNDTFEGPLSKNLSADELNKIKEIAGLENNDLFFAVADRSYENACNALGAIRSALGKRFAADKLVGFDLLWVTDFPMFEWDYDEEAYAPSHHPFTRPYAEDIQYLDSDPGRVRSHHYDLVLNGYELGSGSLRIYDEKLQKKIFEICGLSDEEIKNKFGFFIDAFHYGTPPHGGVAFGLDRIAMILTGSDSIRDVIAFPKNASGVCPMSEAPTPAGERQLKDLHLKVEE